MCFDFTSLAQLTSVAALLVYFVFFPNLVLAQLQFHLGLLATTEQGLGKIVTMLLFNIS